MKPLCTLQNLSLTFPHKKIFQNASFTLNEGDKVGVLGLNGHGKSSLFKVLAATLTPDTTVPPFIFDKAKEFSLFYVPQELPSLDQYTVSDYFYEFHPELLKIKLRLDKLSEMFMDDNADHDKLIDEQTRLYDEFTRLGEAEIHEKYLSYLKNYEVLNLDKKMSELSGGEQRKVAIALGFSCPHKIVLFDEPTNHLDIGTIEEFEEELQNLKKTFMIISHDRSLLTNVTSKILHIKEGHLRSFDGNYEEYIEFLLEEDKNLKAEISRLNNSHRRETAWIKRGAKARRTKSKKRIEEYENLTSHIQELKSKSHKTVSLNLKHSGRKSKMLIEAKELTHSFGAKALFANLNFKIAKGDKIALLGDNGVGKSTLLKILQKEIEPTAGSVHHVEGLSIGYFSQKREALNDSDTPWNLIGDGQDFVHSNDGTKRHVASYLEGFLFKSEELKRPISTFSGGEKNRLQLAKFMKDAKDLWIFDEPTNDLDIETIGVLEEELKNYEGAVIIVGHDRSFINNVTDSAYLIYDKKLEIFEGGYEQAEYFLEAIELEKKAKSKVQRNVQKNTPKSDSNKASNVQKKIEACEFDLEKLNEEFLKIDYQNEGTSKATELQKKISLLKEELDALYLEWEALL